VEISSRFRNLVSKQVLLSWLFYTVVTGNRRFEI
jgi:hypothetical protein